MAYEIKDNTGSIFANDRKETESHPDGKGSAMVGGVEYWISSWNNKTKDGKPYRKLSFQPKEQKADHQNERPVAQTVAKRHVGGISDAAMDDEIPFAPEVR